MEGKRWNQILTEEQAQQIAISDKPAKELMEIYGVSKSLISKIRNGHRWKNTDTQGITPRTRKITGRGFIDKEKFEAWRNSQ